MREFAIFYEFGGWIIEEMRDGMVVGSLPPAPTLEAAIDGVAHITGAPVGIKLIANG